MASPNNVIYIMLPLPGGVISPALGSEMFGPACTRNLLSGEWLPRSPSSDHTLVSHRRRVRNSVISVLLPSESETTLRPLGLTPPHFFLFFFFCENREYPSWVCDGWQRSGTCARALFCVCINLITYCAPGMRWLIRDEWWRAAWLALAGDMDSMDRDEPVPLPATEH